MRALAPRFSPVFCLLVRYGQNGLNNENSSSITSASVAANDNALIVIAQDTTAKSKKKMQLRRVCPAGQIRCACADTGTRLLHSDADLQLPTDRELPLTCKLSLISWRPLSFKTKGEL
jgi:hypothetical protein